MNEKWDVDIVAETDGYMAILPFGEIKTEFKKNAKAFTLIYQLASRRAYEINYFNLTGEKRNPICDFTHQSIH